MPCIRLVIHCTCMCMCYQVTHVRCTCTQYGMSKGAGQASKMKAERDGRETRPEQARMDQQTSRQVSEGQL